MPLPVTALHAGLLALWVVWLAACVGAARTRHGVMVGDGGVPELVHRIRAHGNAVETVPLALILLALAEGYAAPAWVLHVLGLMLLAGRVLHGLYFLRGARSLALRGAGMGLTVLMIVLAALGLVGHALAGLLGGTAA